MNYNEFLQKCTKEMIIALINDIDTHNKNYMETTMSIVDLEKQISKYLGLERQRTL